MKKILSIIATSLLWVSSAEAGVPLIQEQGSSRYTIQLDSISMTIDTSLRQSWKNLYRTGKPRSLHYPGT